MQAWRLSKARYAGDLSGVGAAREGQRWNHPGQRAVYLGLTPEITVLEMLVHFNGAPSAPLALCCYELPDEAELMQQPGLADLPLAVAWLSSMKGLALVLPSVVVPQARNLLVNPLHPAIERVRLVDQAPFRLDQRLS